MAKVKFNLEADEAKAVNAFLRVVDAQQKAERSMGGVNRRSQEQNKVFGQLNSSIKGYIAGFATLGTVTQALRMFNEELNRNAEIIKSSERIRSQTLSLAAGDKTTAAFLREQEEKYATTAGVSPENASQAVFNIKSIFSEDKIAEAVDFVSKADSFVRDSGKFAEGIGTVQNALGEAETGGVAQLGNKIFAAANVSKTDPSEFGNELSKIAKTGATVGGSDEILSSALAIGSAGQATTAEAGTRIRAFLVELIRNEVEGATLEDKFQNVLKSGINKQNFIKDFGGGNEALEGFAILSDNWDRIINLSQKLKVEEGRAGTPQSFLNKTIALRNADPILQEAFRSRQLEQEVNQVTESFGLQKIGRENAVKQAIADRGRSGELSVAGKVTMDAVGAGVSMLPVEPSTAAGATAAAGEFSESPNLGLLALSPLAGVLERLTSAVEAFNKASEKQEKNANKPMARNNGMVE
jgi:uncharacterized membrane protein